MWMQVSSLPTNSSLENTPRYQFSLKSETIDKMATIANQRLANANIKIKQIVKNSKMKRFQWKWIFTGGRTCCTIWRPFWFAMAAILNPKWPPKNKNPPIWKKFDFQIDFDAPN
jgi:hypothetical protein